MFQICSAANIFRTRTLSSIESGGQFPIPWRGVPLLNRRGVASRTGRKGGGAFQGESREKKAVLSKFLSKYFAYVYYCLQVIIFFGPHYLFPPPHSSFQEVSMRGEMTPKLFLSMRNWAHRWCQLDNRHFCILSHETFKISHLEL